MPSDAQSTAETEAELQRRVQRLRALALMGAKAPNNWKELATAFRESARRLRDGKVSKNAGITRLLIVCSDHRPVEGTLLQDLLCAAESHEARGDRSAALKHLQAAIDLSLAMASRPGKPVALKQEAQGMTGEEWYKHFVKDVGKQFNQILPWENVPSRYKDAWNTIAEMTEPHKKPE
jgi:hypothetical protein